MKTTAQILNYLDGTLGGNELTDFLQLMERNAEIKELVALHKEVDKALKDKAAISLREKLNQAYNEFMSRSGEETSSETKTRRITFKPFFKYAAAILLVLGTGITYLIIKHKTYAPDQLYSMYYQPYETDIIIRSTDSGNTELMTGIEKYQNGEYSTANEIFTQLIQAGDAPEETHFFNALTLIGMENYEEAITNLEIVIRNKSTAYTTHADWYLGLCYLRLEEKEKAITIFRVLCDSTSHYYSTKAKEILNKMDN